MLTSDQTLPVSDTRLTDTELKVKCASVIFELLAEKDQIRK